MLNRNINPVWRRRLVLIAAAGWTLIIPLLALLPAAFFGATGDIGKIPGLDKIVHAFIYGLQAALLIMAFRTLSLFPLRCACRLAVLIASVYGLLMEVLQHLLTSARQFSWGDVLANFCGAVVVSIFLFLYFKKVQHGAGGSPPVTT